MAGDWHESIVNLIQDRPDFAAELIGVADAESYGDIEVAEADRTANAVGSKATTERRADAVTTLTLRHSEVEKLLVISEVQNEWSDEKQRRLLGYVSRAFEDHEKCEVELLMICRSDKLAKRYQQGIRVNRRWRLVPLTLSPSDLPPFTDPYQPGATAESATLRLLLNPEPKGGTEAVISTVDELLGTIETGRASDYSDMLLQSISANARQLLEAIMMTETRPYHSEFTDRYLNKGREQEREQALENDREVLVGICGVRSIELSAAERAMIEECDDFGQLKKWMVRAAAADNAEQVFDS